MFAENLTRKLLRDHIISADDYDIVRYGLENIGSNLAGISIVLAIGGIFGHILDGFVLWLMVFPLRKHAGGYHAKTRTKCYFVSTGMIMTAFACFLYKEWSIQTYLCIVAVFFVIIFVLSPIENANKPLDAISKRIFRKRTRGILLVETILGVLPLFLGKNDMLKLTTMSFSIVGISLLMGKVQIVMQEKAMTCEK